MRFFIAPAVFFSIFIYGPLVFQQYWFIFSFFASDLILGMVAGIDYKFRDRKAKNWIYKPFMNIISSLVLSWVIIPALLTYRQNKWLTR
jgi:hyaluronan synthase